MVAEGHVDGWSNVSALRAVLHVMKPKGVGGGSETTRRRTNSKGRIKQGNKEDSPVSQKVTQQ